MKQSVQVSSHWVGTILQQSSRIGLTNKPVPKMSHRAAPPVAEVVMQQLASDTNTSPHGS